ncbi:insulin-like growth factor-binding protein complex acid labile subunit, partial [Nilaparvata lugens]|uniref:insulin-like growth factor-binding protein complex acid labile subunit n=1 Tax=Nilaparvata lugens TaxID=108931 RepID=UPI00193CCE89
MTTTGEEDGRKGLPLRVMDFSHNSLRRLPERVFLGLQDSLQELRLSGNLLGDSLNPIFSSSEFHGLSNLRLLDLSDNQIKAIEEGLLKGCDNLRELWLNDNSLTLIPSTSLNGPTHLKVLSLSNNRI